MSAFSVVCDFLFYDRADCLISGIPHLTQNTWVNRLHWLGLLLENGVICETEFMLLRGLSKMSTRRTGARPVTYLKQGNCKCGIDLTHRIHDATQTLFPPAKEC